MLKQSLCVIWAALPSKCWCLGPALSYNWLPLLVAWLLSLQGADFTCLKEETSLWFLVKILDVSCQFYWQEDCTCWGIFLFLLKRDTINISNLIPGKSISHSQTIQAAQGILCPCTAAAKGSQHNIVDMETRHLPLSGHLLCPLRLAQITKAEVRADPSKSFNKKFQTLCCPSLSAPAPFLSKTHGNFRELWWTTPTLEMRQNNTQKVRFKYPLWHMVSIKCRRGSVTKLCTSFY